MSPKTWSVYTWLLIAWIGVLVLSAPYIGLTYVPGSLRWLALMLGALLIYIPAIVFWASFCHRASGMATSYNPRQLGFSWPKDLSMARAIDVGIGILLPIMAYGVILAIQLGIGWKNAVVLPQANIGSMFLGLLTGAILPSITGTSMEKCADKFAEEAVFRGFMLHIQLRNIHATQRKGGWVLFGQASLNAFAFMTVHIPSQLAIDFASANIFFLIKVVIWFYFGLFFFYYALYSGHLWGVFTYHMIWDWMDTIVGSFVTFEYLNDSVTIQIVEIALFFVITAITWAIVIRLYHNRHKADYDALIKHGETFEEGASLVQEDEFGVSYDLLDK